MIYVVLMDRGLKRTTYRNSSNIHADRVLTFLVGEPSVHELALLALYSQEPTFKTEFTFQILKKKRLLQCRTRLLSLCQYRSLQLSDSAYTLTYILLSYVSDLSNYFRLQQSATLFSLTSCLSSSIQNDYPYLELQLMCIGC